MLVKSGRIVQEQTARIPPEMAATLYDSHFLALAPKYLMTEPWLTKTAITPAMKKAGSRQRMTCSRAYHRARSSVASMAVMKRSLPSGRKKTAAKTRIIHARIFNSR